MGLILFELRTVSFALESAGKNERYSRSESRALAVKPRGERGRRPLARATRPPNVVFA